MSDSSTLQTVRSLAKLFVHLVLAPCISGLRGVVVCQTVFPPASLLCCIQGCC